MKIQKTLTVTPQEKKELQTAIKLINSLMDVGNEFCKDMICIECPFHNKNYVCPIDTFSSNYIDNDLEDFINKLPVAEED